MNEQWASQYHHAQSLLKSGQTEEARLFALSVLEHLECVADHGGYPGLFDAGESV